MFHFTKRTDGFPKLHSFRLKREDCPHTFENTHRRWQMSERAAGIFFLNQERVFALIIVFIILIFYYYYYYCHLT